VATHLSLGTNVEFYVILGQAFCAGQWPTLVG